MELTMTREEYRKMSRKVDNGYPIIDFINNRPMYNNSMVKKAFFGYKRLYVHRIPIRIVEEEKNDAG